MNEQAVLWLYPILFLSIVAVVSNLRIGIKWSWPLCLQWSIVLLVALTGLLSRHKAPFAVASWAMFAVLIFVPRFYLRRLEKDLSLLMGNRAVANARALKFFYWGQLGQLWEDMACAVAYFLDGNAQSIEKAESIIDRWQAKGNLPVSVRMTLATYAMNGYVLARDWTNVARQYSLAVKQCKGRLPWSVANLASRAYAEQGRFDQAYEALANSNINQTRLSEQVLDLVFLPFFALCGAGQLFNEIISRLDGEGQALPVVSRTYWQARALACQGQTEQAISTLIAAKAGLDASQVAWVNRIDALLVSLQQSSYQAASVSDVVINKASNLYHRARLLSEVILPGPSQIGVSYLLAMISIIYVVSHLFSLSANDLSTDISSNMFNLGMLDPTLVMQGQYWRLITYLFLHANLAHLTMNLIGLWWFGRWSESLFGTNRFMFLFFATGIISGAVETFAAPTVLAVGASGAIMGLFGATVAAIFRLKDILPKRLRLKELTWMLTLIFVQIVFDQLVPKIAAFAHIGGLVSGMALGLLLKLKVQDKIPPSSKL